jgi:hypothetical protein
LLGLKIPAPGFRQSSLEEKIIYLSRREFVNEEGDMLLGSEIFEVE